MHLSIVLHGSQPAAWLAVARVSSTGWTVALEYPDAVLRREPAQLRRPARDFLLRSFSIDNIGGALPFRTNHSARGRTGRTHPAVRCEEPARPLAAAPENLPKEFAELNDEFTSLAHRLQQSHPHRDELVQNLDQKVATRTSQLAEARDQADVANRTKSAFLTNMSHEIHRSTASLACRICWRELR